MTHERYVEDMESTIIKGDVVHRFKTVKTGTNTKTLMIEQENMKERMAGLMITPDGAKIETSVDDYSYDSERKRNEMKRQKRRLTRAEREAKSKLRGKETKLSSSESEAETDAIYDWLYGQNQKGEPAQVVSKVDEVQLNEAETANHSNSQLSDMDEFVPSFSI